MLYVQNKDKLLKLEGRSGIGFQNLWHAGADRCSNKIFPQWSAPHCSYRDSLYGNQAIARDFLYILNCLCCIFSQFHFNLCLLLGHEELCKEHRAKIGRQNYLWMGLKSHIKKAGKIYKPAPILSEPSIVSQLW